MGKLYVVPTPIGNLDDITIRAINLLKQANYILAEDTRTTGKLLKHYEIATPLKPYHQHNEHAKVKELTTLIKNNTVALVSDAGTPGISDPGYLLVKHCLNEGIEVETLPGATALIPALVNSGIANHHFTFYGFLPVKKGRSKLLEQLKDEAKTMVFYESPHRLVKTLSQFVEYFGANRNAYVGRELSKLHEEHVHGSVTEILTHFKGKTVKGELVLVVKGKQQ